MAVNALRLSSAKASSGGTMTIALPSGPVTATIPPVRNGQVLKIQTPQGTQYLRVRLTLSPARLLAHIITGFMLLLMVALGPGALIASAFAPPPDPNAAPTCDGQTMDTADRCELSGDVNGTYDYMQMQQLQAQQLSPGRLVAVGSILTGMDAVGVAVYLVQRRSVRRHPIPVRIAPAVTNRA